MGSSRKRKDSDSAGLPDRGALRSAKKADELARAAERVEAELLRCDRNATKKIAEIDDAIATLEAFHKIEKSYLKNSQDPRPKVIETLKVIWTWGRPRDSMCRPGTEEVLRLPPDWERPKPWDHKMLTLWQLPHWSLASDDTATDTAGEKPSSARARRHETDGEMPLLLTKDGEVLELMEDIPEPEDD